MLTTIQENVTVGRDGLIQLHARGLEYNSRISVVAVIESKKEQNIEEDWQSFIEKTAGALSETPIARYQNMNLEKRSELL